MLAVVNANYEFMYVDIGKNGRNSDGSIIDQTEFYKRLKEGKLNLPSCEQTFEGMNFVFVADDAFALSEHIMKPFPMRNLTRNQRIFNYRLSRARRVVENAFGILANRFRIFLTSINLAIYKIDCLVMCCCVLHNYLRRNSNGYMTLMPFEREPDVPTSMPGSSNRGENQEHMDVLTSLNSGYPRLPAQNARQCRLDYMEYFVGRGSVSWQDDK